MRAALALAATVTSLATLAPPAQASAEWNPGTHDEDSIINCQTGLPSTGVSADVGWRSSTGEVPRVGEVFYVRAYAGLVGLPCSSGVAVLPELMLPAGVLPADDKAPIYWDLTRSGTSQQLRTTPLTFAQGRNGGYLIGSPEGLKWELARGDVLEIQVPVTATRELKGPATQQPTCQSRANGSAPCPISQSGDHFQMAFTVSGHGGDKSYVTPFVGLFAQLASTGGTGGTGTGDTGTGDTGTGGTGTGGTGGSGVTRVSSRTTATYAVHADRRGKAVIKVASSTPAFGKVIVRDGRKVVGTAKVRNGRATVALPRLGRGRHTLTAAYSGSPSVLPSVSPSRKVTLR